MDDFHINKIVQLSCGPGWFTYWLRKYGILVEKCVDNFTWKESFKNKSYLSFVEKGDSIEAAKVDNVEMFILSWPYMDSVAANIWKEMKRGKYLLYIGEEKGGCTADDEFFNLIENKEIQRGFPFLSFPNIHDRPILFQK